MTASDRTKQLLAEGIKNLSETTPFHKIRVGDLCKRCGIDRRTFYYHFRDIYDLAAWIFDQVVDTRMPDASGRFTTRALVQILSYFRDEPVFYRRALAEDSQNALGRHVMEHNVQMYTTAICRLRGVKTLSEEEQFAICYHGFGSIAMIRRWIFAGCTPPPEQMARLLTGVMPNDIRELYGLERTGKGDCDDDRCGTEMDARGYKDPS